MLILLLLLVNAVYAPSSFPTCDADSSCGYGTFTCPYFKTGRCDIVCTDYNSCVDSKFYCPQLPGYDCSLTVQSDSSASGTTIYAAEMEGGTLSIDLEGTGFWVPFSSGIIHCPIAGICTITMTGKGMRSTVINATHSTQLTIDIYNGEDSLTNAQIYCPDNGHSGEPSCVINAYSTVSAWDGTKITAVEGFAADLSLYCDSGSDCGTPTLYCGEKGEWWCTPVASDSYKYCSPITHICNTWLYPTYAPSKPPTLPTESPTALPTPSPVFSTNVIYIRYKGADEEECSLLKPCGSIDYAYNCITYECDYDGRGTIYIGEGVFPFHKQHVTNYGDLVFKGDGSAVTAMSMNSVDTESLTWFGCGSVNCWIGLEGLTLYSNRTRKDDIHLLTRGGTMYFKDVVFDGDNFVDGYYEFSSGANIVFENCVFTHLDTSFKFTEDAKGYFIDCVFVDNDITLDAYDSTIGFISIVSGATVTFTRCRFDNNNLWRPLIQMGEASQVILNQTVMVHNEGKGVFSIFLPSITPSLIYVSITNCYVQIIDSSFNLNMYFNALIELMDLNTLVMNGVTFSYNQWINYDIYSYSMSTIDISNCVFSNSDINASSVAGYSLLNVVISDTVWDTYTVTNKETEEYLLHFITPSSDVIINGIQMYKITGVGGVYISAYPMNVYLTDSLFSNIAIIGGYDNLIVVAGGLEFKKNTVQYIDANILSIHSLASSLDFEDNIFAYNTGDYIVDYQPILIPDTFIHFDLNNQFIANRGGIFNLQVNDSYSLKKYATNIYIHDVVIRDYEKPSSALFTISSDGGSKCSSEGIDWSTDAPIFSTMNITNNINTQIISTLCIQVHVDTVYLANNTMSIGTAPSTSNAMFLFQDWSTVGTVLTDFMVMNNQGIMIEVYAGIMISSHIVTNHRGIYLYNSQQNLNDAYYVRIVIQNITITSSQSMFSQGLLYFIGEAKQITTSNILFDDLYLYDNIGSLITIKASTFDDSLFAGIVGICPEHKNDASVQFINSKIESNTLIKDTYLFGIQGVTMWLNHDVYIMNNDCGAMFGVSCLLLLDGWYTIDNINVNDTDKNFITFGHGGDVTAYYDAKLCMNYSLTASSTTAMDIETYLDYMNINTPPLYGEKVIFYPCTTTSKLMNNNSFLHEIGIDHSQTLDFSGDGANILQDTFCNETDCEVLCLGSVSCFGSSIYCNSGICNINCSEQYSCANIKIYSDKANASVSVFCDGLSACSTGLIQINNAAEFKLICGESSSCLDATVHVQSDRHHMSAVSEIYCNEYESCESMTINTTNRDTTVYMYQYSSDITMITPTGYIADPDTNEHNLLCGNPQDYIIWDSDAYHSVSDALKAHYSFGQLPCDMENIKFFCSNFTDLDGVMESCLIGSETVETKNYDLFECYPLFVTSLVDTYCDGSCPNSPTSPPTMAPTASPTKTTLNPTNAPTIAPTEIPTNAPTNVPTLHPSLAPSTAPVPPPTISPTIPPTTAPSLTPTLAPSLAPSLSPTISPSPAPSRAPTNKDEYDSFIPITFVLHYATKAIRSIISDNANTSAIYDIQKMVERGFFDDPFLLYERFAVYIDTINDVEVKDIDKTSWIKWGKESDPLMFLSHIDCSYDACVVITTSDMNRHDENEANGGNGVNVNAEALTISECNDIRFFQLSVQCNIRNYFNWNELEFTVNSAETIDSSIIKCYDCDDTSFDYLLIGIFGFLGLMALLSALAFLYNNQLFCTFPGMSPVDDAKYLTLLIFGIQAWDFISDINLAFEIWDDLNGNGIPDSEEENAENITLTNANILIIISGSGAVLFVLVPYIVNLIVAANIKRMIRKNDAAKAYFQYYAAVFVAFVVLSGGAYPALAVVSSEIFGLAVFNSGLTAFELRSLSKIKVFGTIILENLPQIGCQILYSWTIGNFTRNTQLAFCASLLSVTASTLSYYIEKNAADTTAISYYLAFQCKHKRATPRASLMGNEISPYDAIDHTEIVAMRPTSVFNKYGGEIVQDDTPNTETKQKLGITEREKDKFWRNKGLKFKLSKSIAEVFGISENNIEIGYVQITKYGIIMHIIHYVYSTDLDELERELNEENINISIGSSYYTEHCLYGSFKTEVDEVFTNHFDLEANDFEVKYHKRYPIKKHQKQAEESEESLGQRELQKKKSSIVHGMALHLKKMQTLNVPGQWNVKESIEMVNMNDKNKKHSIKGKLDGILDKYKFASQKEEVELLFEWIKERNNIYDNSERKEEDDKDNALPIIKVDNFRLRSTEL